METADDTENIAPLAALASEEVAAEPESGSDAGSAPVTAQDTPGDQPDDEVRTFQVRMGGIDYTVTHSPEQWKRLQAIIYRKDVPTEVTAGQITADHIQSVQNWGDLYINMELEAIADHDSRKLKQTPEEHHEQEVHHWALDGYKIVNGYLPLQYAAETTCDYAATVYGRAFAGRGLEWIPPTNGQTVADSVAATFLCMLQRYDLATITPALPTLGGESVAEEHTSG